MTLREEKATHRIKVTGLTNADDEAKLALAELVEEHPEVLCWEGRSTAEWIMGNAGVRPAGGDKVSESELASMQLTCEVQLRGWLDTPVGFACEIVPADYQGQLFLPDDDRTADQEASI